MSLDLPFIFVDAAARAGDPRARELLTPRRASADAAGIDLVAANETPIALAPGERALIPTGIAVAIPPGHEGSVRPRSGLALHHGVTCLNAPGTIDADYRGEVGVILINHGQGAFSVTRGMRIAQLVVSPVAMPVPRPCESLSSTQRGQGGFGSTG